MRPSSRASARYIGPIWPIWCASIVGGVVAGSGSCSPPRPSGSTAATVRACAALRRRTRYITFGPGTAQRTGSQSSRRSGGKQQRFVWLALRQQTATAAAARTEDNKKRSALIEIKIRDIYVMINGLIRTMIILKSSSNSSGVVIAGRYINQPFVLVLFRLACVFFFCVRCAMLAGRQLIAAEHRIHLI